MNEQVDNSKSTGPKTCCGGGKPVNVEDLLGGKRELKLMYGREEYRLRITRNSKLILTK